MRNKTRILSLLLFLVSLVSLQAVGGTILVFGDSLSASYGIDTQRGWVALLQKRLQEQRSTHNVINASISGDTTANGLARLPATLSKYKPTVVILELGGNDGLRGLSLSQMKNNIAAMVRQAQKQSAKVVLVGIRLPPNYGRRYTQKFQDVYKNIADEHQLPFVPRVLDGIGKNLELMQADGIHPKAEAQPIILENIWRVLQPLL